MSKHPQWAVSPLLTPWRGDMRRNAAPYVLTGGFNMSCYSYALWVKRVLESRGIRCFVEIIEV